MCSSGGLTRFLRDPGEPNVSPSEPISAILEHDRCESDSRDELNYFQGLLCGNYESRLLDRLPEGETNGILKLPTRNVHLFTGLPNNLTR